MAREMLRQRLNKSFADGGTARGSLIVGQHVQQTLLGRAIAQRQLQQPPRQLGAHWAHRVTPTGRHQHLLQQPARDGVKRAGSVAEHRREQAHVVQLLVAQRQRKVVQNVQICPQQGPPPLPGYRIPTLRARAFVTTT